MTPVEYLQYIDTVKHQMLVNDSSRMIANNPFTVKCIHASVLGWSA